VNRAAGVVSTLTGLGFGIPGIVGLAHFSRSGTTWTFHGFPTYGGGPFERIGLDTSVPLLAGVVGVCAAEIALGVLILQGAPSVRAASSALVPFELGFWVGFALPFGFVLGLVRVLMLAPRPRW
jgi:hypothetical protein